MQPRWACRAAAANTPCSQVMLLFDAIQMIHLGRCHAESSFGSPSLPSDGGRQKAVSCYVGDVE